MSFSERFHWIRWECRAAAGEGEVLVVCHKFWGAAQRAGEDLVLTGAHSPEFSTLYGRAPSLCLS